MQQLNIGATLQNGKYEIMQVLGQGGFGITYLARHVMLNTFVAIKEFFPKTICDRDQTTSQIKVISIDSEEDVKKLRKKFIREFRNLASLKHSGIVKVHDIFEDNDTAYAVMDYVDGKPLSQIVKETGALPEAKALKYILQVADALIFMHSKNMMHLDVKPANIMISNIDDSAILIDFGLSKQYDENTEHTTTMLGISQGYSPTEQYHAGGIKEFSPQSDLYSLAATLYYVLSGVIPPHSLDLLEEELTFPSNLPSYLIPPISKAMSPIRRNRQKDIPEFMADIQTCFDKKESEISKSTMLIKHSDFSEKTSEKEETIILGPQTKSNKSKGTNEVSRNLNSIQDNENQGRKKLIAKLFLFVIVVIVIALTAIPIYFGIKNSDKSDLDILPAEAPTLTLSNPDGSIDNYEYVDLGLPSGLMWSTCNIGSENPWESGTLFAWGETKTKPRFIYWDNDMYAKSIDYLKHSGVISASGILNHNYDAATFNQGMNWRMPTKNDFEELIQTCTWEWKTDNGLSGYQITGLNGNSIFLPVSHRITGNSSVTDSEFSSWYWCSNAYIGKESNYSDLSSYCLHFNDNIIEMVYSGRGVGQAIRPVCDNLKYKNNLTKIKPL